MTSQMQGEILFKGWNGNSPTLPDPVDAGWAKTPWMPAGSDFATYAVEVLNLDSGLTFNWTVETRTRETTTVTTIVATQTGSVGINSVENTNAAKELVRYRFKTGSSANTTDFVVFRALPPSWHRDR